MCVLYERLCCTSFLQPGSLLFMFDATLQVSIMIYILLQAFKRWIPSLTDDSINVILTTKGCGSFRLVNIISYDLLVKMNKEVQAKRFMAVIAVREIPLPRYNV